MKRLLFALVLVITVGVPGSAFATKRTVDVGVATQQVILGHVIAAHGSITTFSYDYVKGTKAQLLTPKGTYHSWGTTFPSSASDPSERWVWYDTGEGGTGRADYRLTITFGVKTPFGVIGTQVRDTHTINVDGSGRKSISTMGMPRVI